MKTSRARTFRCFLACLSVTVILGLCQSRAADAPPKDAIALLSQIRLKQLTKELTLTEEQQKKIQSLFNDEGARIRVIQSDEAADSNQKREKQTAIKKETN